MKTKTPILFASLFLGFVLSISCAAKAAGMFATPAPAISVSTSLTTPPPTPLVSARANSPTSPVFISHSSVISTTTPDQTQFSPDDMDALTGPIALYPDALIAIILPASTYLVDIVLAARFLEAGGDSARAQTLADSQPWDQSVRALAHYPDVLHWMDENRAWTRQLGAAFLTQPEDVMASIQRLRARAQAAGNLSTNVHQTVFAQDDYIRIVPTYEEVLYVPYYDPMEAFYQPVAFGWGPPWAIGRWLVYDCNWIGLNIWIGPWSLRYFMTPQWGAAAWRRISPKWLLQHVWRPAPSRSPNKPFMPSPQLRLPVVRPAPIANVRLVGAGSAGAGVSGLPRRFVAPKALRPSAAAAAPATTMAGIVNQSVTKTSQSRVQTQTRTQTRPRTPQPQNNNSGNASIHSVSVSNSGSGNNSSNNNSSGNPRNVQRPVTLPPARYATQGATRNDQPAQQQSRWSGESGQPQSRWFGQSSSGQQQQQSYSAGGQAGHAGNAGNASASNAAASNSNASSHSGKPAANSRSSGNTNSSTHYSPPSSSTNHYSPPSSSSSHDSSSSSSSHASSSSSSSSSSRDSNSRDDSDGHPHR